MAISVAIEARGTKLISLMKDAMKAVAVNATDILTALLYTLADGLNDLAIILKRMYQHTDAAFFFHQLRPLLAGSKNMGHAGLPKGVYYDVGGDEKPENWLQLSGGSNAQSSLIQAFDIFLGVEHSATGGKKASGPTFIHVRYILGLHCRRLPVFNGLNVAVLTTIIGDAQVHAWS
jgi:indoleamine 2,3-dioxygenase